MIPSLTDPRRRITLERTFKAPIEDVWALWTTPRGVESWWGPEGFSVTVQSMDLQVGGQLRYTMTATAAPQIGFMKQHGMPLSTLATITYTEIEPLRRLGYQHRVDFVPGVTAYDTGTLVELEQLPDGVRMRLIIDAMHNEEWTQRAVMGWESELEKLARRIEQGAAA